MTPRTMRRGALALITAAAAGAAGMTAVAATQPTATRNLTNGANEFSYRPAVLRVVVPRGRTATRVILRYRNTGFAPHDVAIAGRGIRTRRSREVPRGGRAGVSAVLRPGTYRYFCTVPGHAAAGMKGTLRVVRAR